ncbi:MAG: hypothetical protein HYT20_03085, partial [Candidatus Nealsonbacteria bacterium]|nr:hypothetical protein [Candidatus Nealsonbacteria bacterium]
MPEKEPQFNREMEGLEKWLHDVPVETVGTEKERQENLERFSEELKIERDGRGILEEEYRERLERAKSFLENLPLIHVTSFASIERILDSGKVLSISEIKKNEEHPRGNTFPADQEAGFDKFVFAGLGNVVIGDAAVVFKEKILDRPDCFITAEDVVDVPKRLLDAGFRWPTYDWKYLTKEKNPAFFAEVLKEYRKQTLAGKDFKRFLADFIATHCAKPEEYVGFSDSEVYKKAWSRFYHPFSSERQPLFPMAWHNPEIKVMKEIGIDDIRFIMVGNIETAESLARYYKIPLDRFKVRRFITIATMKELWETCGYD